MTDMEAWLNRNACKHRSTEIDHNGRTLCTDCGDILDIPEKETS